MRTVYVTQDGATVRREGGRLVVSARRQVVAEVLMQDLHQLVLMGNVMLTPAAMDLLIAHRVDTVFVTSHGRYRGRIVHGLSGNVKLRLRQYKTLQEPAVAITVARTLVRAKLENARVFVLRFARRHGDPTEALERAARAQRAATARVGLAQTLDEVRGCEGSAAAAYFRSFGALLRAEGFTFNGRSRRPPLDPVNALLSVGYTILANATEAATEIVGLDPYVGALHSLEAGRPSLVCDLMEEMRVPVIDAVVVASLNKGVLRPDDFESVGEGEPVIVKREAMTTFARIVEKRLSTPVYYPPTETKLTYRQVLEQQARAFARWVMGTAPDYVPFTLR